MARDEIEAAMDAEVLQEILHRYRSIQRWQDGCRVYDLARQIIPLVLPITVEILDATRALLNLFPALKARDAGFVGRPGLPFAKSPPGIMIGGFRTNL